MLYIIISLPLLIIGAWFAVDQIRSLRRQQLFKKETPDIWLKVLEQNVPLYKRLPVTLRQQLHGHMHIFLHEKQFKGCAGQSINDEIRITIAAQACMLLLNKNTRYYPYLKTILVYPTAYFANRNLRDAGLETHKREVRYGESWHRGPVVLAWNQTLHSATDINDGHNLVLHEFAHQLDQEDHFSDGAPILNSQSQYITWARVLGREFKELQFKTENDEESILDAYGAKSPAEFFAVATETFFEKSQQLKNHKPELYETLQSFYAVDPASW